MYFFILGLHFVFVFVLCCRSWRSKVDI